MCKRFLTVLLILSFITPLFYLPQQAQKAEALFGIGDLVIDIKALADRVVDGFAMVLAQKMIDRMVASTVKWAQSGFEGNPAYATDPEQYFTDIVDGVAGEFIQQDLNYLCSPFQANIKLSLTQQYYEPEPFQCTLTDVIGNIESFYNDFSQGGWDAWFSMTQTPTNNPYGAYLKAKIELDSQTASALGLKEKELDWNQGFLSWSECTKKNPAPFDIVVTQTPNGPVNGTVHNPGHVPGKAEGECIERGPTKTPGSTIKAQLDEVLPSGLQKLIGAQHIDQLVNAFAAGLLQRYVLGPKGLFNNEKYAGNEGKSIINPTGAGPGDEGGGSLDIDGDGIPDGLDTDGDGDLDLCYFGGSEGVIGPPCVGSNEEIINSTNGGGSPTGGQCSVSGQQYEGALRDAMNEVLAENPEVGDLPNIESGGRQNARTFLALVETKLQSMGYRASDDVLNGNNNPNTGDLIAVWKDGDSNPQMVERYDAIIGAASTIRTAITADFTGFVPLGCTDGTSKDCGCKSNTGAPSPTNPTPVPTEPTGVNPPLISSVSPTSVTAGQTTLAITGTDLTATVQFFDGSGNRNTVLGSVNSAKTQVTVLVPGNLPSGNATVKIYKDASTVSNGKLIQVTNAGTASIPTVTPTSVWSPTHTTNGWWPALSPDGRYVAYGNWGGSYVTDLESPNKSLVYDFSNPPELPANSRCMAGQWISATKLTFICEIGPAANQGKDGFLRYEVTVGEWVARKTADDPALVRGNMFAAADGHWASYLASNPTRLAKDNAVVGTGTGGGISISGNALVYACTNDNKEICVKDGNSVKKYTTLTPNFGTAAHNGYIMYGGYGPVRGITPSGFDFDLTVAPWRWEGIGDILTVGNAVWVASTSWNSAANKSYVFLRPWGSLSVIPIAAEATYVSVAHKNGVFTVAYNSETGALQVVTVPADAQRSTLK